MSFEVILTSKISRFIFKPYIRAIELLLDSIVRLLGINLELSANFPKKSVDERIAKIDVARKSLNEVILALNDLASEAERAKNDLQLAQIDLKRTEEVRKSETEQLLSIRSLAQNDVIAFRKLFGIRDPNWERLVGFIGGVVASLVAAGIWKIVEFVLTRISSS